jgi:hypothetical protein
MEQYFKPGKKTITALKAPTKTKNKVVARVPSPPNDAVADGRKLDMAPPFARSLVRSVSCQSAVSNVRM